VDITGGNCQLVANNFHSGSNSEGGLLVATLATNHFKHLHIPSRDAPVSARDFLGTEPPASLQSRIARFKHRLTTGTVLLQ